MEQKIGFCTASDGVRIAYATVGQGPPLVKAPNWLTHLEYEWQSPVWSHWWEELAKTHTVIRFDQRGSGLSEWSVQDMSFDAWCRDLEAVIDHLDLNDFALLGISQGGAAAITYDTAEDVFDAMKAKVPAFSSAEWGRDLLPIQLRFANSRG